jgi:DNA-binding MarR family transcriptional regulator
MNQPEGTELLAYLHQAAAVQGRVESALGSLGLSIGKLGVLRHLAEADEPIPLSELARRCSCVKSNITQLVDRLEEDGLVRRTPDSSDRRCIRTSLTETGQARLAEAQEVVAEEERRLRNQSGQFAVS